MADQKNEGETAVQHKPLKRHRALEPFSREHFNGLVQVRRLRQAADADADQRHVALAAFLENWSREMSAHFDDEERLLGPLMTDEQRSRLHAEHATLRNLAAAGRRRLETFDPGAMWLRELADRLEAHIRWEERELFESVQQIADEASLGALVPAAHIIESERPGARRRGRRCG